MGQASCCGMERASRQSAKIAALAILRPTPPVRSTRYYTNLGCYSSSQHRSNPCCKLRGASFAPTCTTDQLNLCAQLGEALQLFLHIIKLPCEHRGVRGSLDQTLQNIVGPFSSIKQGIMYVFLFLFHYFSLPSIDPKFLG